MIPAEAKLNSELKILMVQPQQTINPKSSAAIVSSSFLETFFNGISALCICYSELVIVNGGDTE